METENNIQCQNYKEVKLKIVGNYNNAWLEVRDKVGNKIWEDVWLQLVAKIDMQVDSRIVPKIIGATCNSLKSLA